MCVRAYICFHFEQYHEVIDKHFFFLSFLWHTKHNLTFPLVQIIAQHCWTFLGQIMAFYIPTKLLTDLTLN